jgi:integrase
MASLVKKVGGTGKETPYWIAVISFQHRKVWKSTRLEQRRLAREVSDIWSSAAKRAQRCELSPLMAAKMEDMVRGLTPNPEVHEATRHLFRYFMKESTGEEYGKDFETFVLDWLELKRGILTNPKSFYCTEHPVREFLDGLSAAKKKGAVRLIRAEDIGRYRDSLRRSGLAGHTVNQRLSRLRELFAYALDQGVVERNVANIKSVEPVSEDDTTIREPFTDEQVVALLSACTGNLLARGEGWHFSGGWGAKYGAEMYGMVLLGACAGLRLRDAADLRWSAIDLEKGALVYQAKKTARRHKGVFKNTVVALSEELREYLEFNIPSSDQADLALFPQFSEIANIGRLFNELMARAGIARKLGPAKTGRGTQQSVLTFHSLRHSFCSRLASAGVPMEVAKSMSGHSLDRTYENYVKRRLEDQRKEMAKVPRLIG